MRQLREPHQDRLDRSGGLIGYHTWGNLGPPESGLVPLAFLACPLGGTTWVHQSTQVHFADRAF